MKKRYRIALWGSAAIVATLAVGAVVAAATFDPNRYKPQIADAVKRATGRDLALNGPITLAWALSPTFEARDVALANVAGGSRPEMMTLGALEARVSLAGLLHNRLDIERLVLVRPDILLETGAGGEPNWRFGPAVRGEPLPQPAPVDASKRPPPELTLRDLRIEDATVTYRAGGADRVLTVQSAEAKAPSREAATEVSLRASYGSTPFTLDGTVGSLAAAQVPDPAVPWPVRLAVASGDARATIAGALRDPMRGRGYDLAMDANAPDLAALQQFVPNMRLPPLQAITAAAKVADMDGRPVLSGLALHAGGSDLGGLLAGLALGSLDVTAPALGEPATVAAKATLNGAPVALTATATQDGARGIALTGLALAMPQADLAGDLTVGTAPRPSLRGTVAANRVDADALAALALAAPPISPPASTPAELPQIPHLPAPPASAAQTPRAGGTWIIPDVPLPFPLLTRADADLAFKVGTLILRGTDYHDLGGHLVLQDGRLRLDPFAVKLPGGPLQATLAADASQPTPPVAVTLRAPGLALTSLLAAARLPPEASGAVDVDLDFAGRGRTPHEIASAASGHLGLASADARIGNRVLAQAIGPILARANLPGIGNPQGMSDVRCFAARLDATSGAGTLRTLLLDTTLAHVEGGGSLNFADETLDLQLRPLVRLGGTGVAVPVRVGGTFRAPSARIDPSGALGEAVQQAETAGAPANNAFNIVIGALGANRMLAGTEARDDCAGALAVARGGHSGPAPAAASPAEPSATADRPKPPKPIDLLRRLLR